MHVERIGLAEWADGLPDSGFEVFHTPAALEVLEAHFPGEMQLFGGFKGDQLVALFPLFVWRGPFGVRFLASPQPTMNVLYLGPIVMPTSPKQRKREQVNTEFVMALLDRIDVDALAVTSIRCSPDYLDPRPFEWAGLSVETSFTYHLDVAERGPEEILRSFSRSRRREIRQGTDSPVTVERGTVADARKIHESQEQLADREGFWFLPSWEYVRDLVSNLGERAQVYVARDPAGDFLGGIVVLYSNDAAYFWMGGTGPSFENFSVNSLLHWHVISDAADGAAVPDVSSYDLIGAGIERLSHYKAKFGPELRPYYQVGSVPIKRGLAKGAWRRGQFASRRLLELVPFGESSRTATVAGRRLVSPES